MMRQRRLLKQETRLQDYEILEFEAALTLFIKI